MANPGGKAATKEGVSEKGLWAYEQRLWKLEVIGNFTAKCLVFHITTKPLASAGDAHADETRCM